MKRQVAGRGVSWGLHVAHVGVRLGHILRSRWLQGCRVLVGLVGIYTRGSEKSGSESATLRTGEGQGVAREGGCALPERRKHRGSQRWLQVAVNRCPEVFDRAVAGAIGLAPGETLEWVSPLESDAFREYRDQEFLDRLGVALNSRPLAEVWPRGGPWWDGLAWTSEERSVLKANIPEFDSDPSGASPALLHRIQAAFAETKAFLQVRSEAGWSRRFYQYASRIAHLYLLGDALRAGGRQPVTASRGLGAWVRGDGCPAPRRQPRWRSRPTGIRRPAPAAHGSPTVSGSGGRPGATG